MADEYISREAFKAEVLSLSTHYLNEWDTLGVLAVVDRIPAADVALVRHGWWENINDLECFMCSCCGECENQPWGLDGAIMFSYCPNCGARMDGGGRKIN